MIDSIISKGRSMISSVVLPKPRLLIERFIPAKTGIRSPKQTKFVGVKGICWHWTASTGKNGGAEAHWAYWHRAENGAHYVVDDTHIIHTVPDNEILWHAGPSTLYTDYIKKKYPKGANACLLGVELCVNVDSKWALTYANAVDLGVYLCKKYKLDPLKNFERHHDCTGKDCPKMMMESTKNGEARWAQFKQDVKNRMTNPKAPIDVKKLNPSNWVTVLGGK